MPRSARFEWVPVRIPRACLLGMWSLTLNRNEWGGQLVPAGPTDGACTAGEQRVGCKLELIRGTGAEAGHPDAERYRGGQGGARMQIAVTPFYDEVFQVHSLCEGRAINCFWHTHPLLMMRHPETKAARLAPPSLGDFFAHSVLSNSRNYRQNRQLNTTVLMAFEGLYVYGVLPHKFRKLMDRADALVAAAPAAAVPAAARREFAAVGELPAAARERLKDEVFDELRPAMAQYTRAMQRLCDRRADCGTAGAVELGDTQWRELVAGRTPPALHFPFARAVDSPELIAFARDNAMTTALAERGYYCLFVPRRNFEDGAVIPAPTTARYCDR